MSSTLEIRSIIFSKTYTRDLELVQYTFLKIIAYVTNAHISRGSYKNIKLSISLDSLNLRRKLSDFLFIYDLLKGHIDCQHSPVLIRVPSYFSRTSDYFVIPYYRKSYSADSFFPRALRLANIISTSLDYFSL